MGTEPVGGRWYQGDQAHLPEDDVPPSRRSATVQAIITACLGLVCAGVWFTVGWMLVNP